MSASRILLVEDFEYIRVLITTLLEEYGYEVISASNGKEGLVYLRKAPLPELIVFDLSMPIMGGVEFRRALMGEPLLKNIPTILFSSEVDAPQIAKELACEGWSTKSSDALVREVLRILPVDSVTSD